MRRNKEYISDEADVMTQAACLNRICRTVDERGVSKEILVELADDIHYISDAYGINAECSVLLAAIVENTASSCNMDDEGLAKYLGCTNIEFIRHYKYLGYMTESGIIRAHTGRYRSYIASQETLKSIAKDCKFTPQAPIEKTVECPDLISAASIHQKALFFNKAEEELVVRLNGLLEEENFKTVQDRLSSSGMRKGFNILFYGDPGTGKTASVYELSRRTGRDIFLVDMSKLWCKWVGDSEKSVKGLFRMYRELCSKSAKAPILLFNEADAIFSKRIENVMQSTDQLHNTLQNIILEEMENLEGILIATTNLLSNLDPAFERRFIYKVEFRKPETESRAKIWKSMIPELSEEDAETLAQKYAFSGGNIENIARKSAVEFVLSGNRPTLSTLENYCEAELVNKVKHNKIGF